MSPGYYGKFIWQKGVSPNGEPYDIIMTDIEKVDHLVITRKARGGHDCKITDSQTGGHMPKILSGLLWQIGKALEHLAGVKDSTAKFRDSINGIIKARDSIKDDEMAKKINELKSLIANLPDNPDKELLGRYIDELPVLKSKPDDLANEAGNKVSNLYEKLDAAAMNDKPTETAPIPPKIEVEKILPQKDDNAQGNEELIKKLDELINALKTVKTGDAEAEEAKNKAEEEAKKKTEEEAKKKEEESKGKAGDASVIFDDGIDTEGKQDFEEIFKKFGKEV